MPVVKIENIKKQIPPLLYPPLVEVIFELHWELLHDQKTGHFRDVSYPVMYGRIYQKLKDGFPELEDLPSNQMHPELSPYVVRHRMRKEKNGYPLVQVGPGIITVNAAKGYSWSSFRSNILKVIESVFDFYPEEADPIRFTKCELRFINGVPLNPPNENPLLFLAEKLHTKIEMDPEFFRENEVNSTPHSVNLNLGYHLKKPKGHLAFSVQLGQFNERPAYIFQTLVQSVQEGVPLSLKSFGPWLEDAHQVAENSFISFCNGFLMEKFCGL